MDPLADDGQLDHESSSETGESGTGAPEPASTDTHDWNYDAFLSYSHADSRNLAAAAKIERDLEAFPLPRAVRERLGRRHLNVFRDVSDLTGSHLSSSLENHLADSRTLIVLCSPSARTSEYVDLEIRRFTDRHGPSRIFPVLIDGSLNHDPEATSAEWALPDALSEVLGGVPFVPDMRQAWTITRRRDKLASGSPWIQVVSNILGIRTAELTDRIAKAERHRLAAIIAALTFVITVISLLGVTAYLQRNEARTQRDTAETRFRDATALRLGADVDTLLAGNTAGGDTRAFQEALAAHALSPELGSAPMLDALVKRRATQHILEGHTDWVSGIAFSPDGRRLVTGAQYSDQSVRQWDAESGNFLGNAPVANDRGVDGFAFSPDGHTAASAGLDDTIRTWNVDSGTTTGEPLVDDSAVAGIAFTSDEDRIVSINKAGIVRFWNLDTRQPVGGWVLDPAFAGGELTVALSPDGRLVATSEHSGNTVRIWSTDTGLPIFAPLTGQADRIMGIAFSPDGRRIATASADKTIWVRDTQSGRPIGAPLTGHSLAVTSVAFSPDGRRLVSGGLDATVRLWDVDSATELGDPFVGHAGGVISVAFSPTGDRVASGGYDDTARIWSTAPALTGAPFSGHSHYVWRATFGPDGTRVASVSSDATLRLWNAATGEQEGAPLTGHRGWIRDVAFSPNGHRLATASDDKTLMIWNADTGKPIGAPLTGHDDEVWGVAYSPNGHRLASAGTDGTVRLWDADTGHPIGQPLTGHKGGVNDVAFSPDGHLLVSGGDDRTVRLWSVDSGREIGAPLEGHTSSVSSVAFSPDGHRVVSGSMNPDMTIRIWNADTAQPIGAPLIGNTDTVASVAFSPDGHHIASAGYDMTVRLWNADTGQPFAQPFVGHTNSVLSVAFSPDGRWVVSAGKDQHVRVWPASADNADLCSRLVANMSAPQWRTWVSPDIPYIKTCGDLPVPN